MTKIHWSNAVDGAFDTAADWDAGAVPGAKDRAFLGALGGSAYTVAASTDEIVRGLRISGNATLAITGGVFVVRRDLGNGGVIALGGGGGEARLEITGATTLSGGGQVVLAGDKSGFIGATRRHHGALTNIDNTISGAGRMEGLGFRFDNQAAGVVNATGARNLVLKHVLCTNAGLLEGTGSGGLTLKATTTILNGAAGIILAGAGSRVHLRGVTISGGTLESTGSGKFVVTGFTARKSGARWDGLTATLYNQARVHIVKAFLGLSGAIDNSGAIVGKRGLGGLEIADRGATLSGGGSVTLHRFNSITGDTSRSTLTNVNNRISGAGAIGAPIGAEGLILVNQQNGVIDASARQGLTINTGANKVRNDGLIEATGRGVGDIVSGVINNGTLMAAGGTLTVERAVTGTGSGAIDGGTLAFGS
ncbi:MAG: hypothetical protein H0X27_01425, partial [Caulobacteraceae bacterium]|nr:hypothetical protein [Caulobacteraceae bacterium]